MARDMYIERCREMQFFHYSPRDIPHISLSMANKNYKRNNKGRTAERQKKNNIKIGICINMASSKKVQKMNYLSID